MRFENIELEELDLCNDSASYNIPATDDLVMWLNEKRKECGQKDLVGWDYENDVWYNFYLIFYPYQKDIRLVGVANESEDDDFVNYECNLNHKEKTMLMWKVITDLIKEVSEP